MPFTMLPAEGITAKAIASEVDEVNDAREDEDKP